MAKNVLERSVLHAGRLFIEVGKSHADAYIIQTGEIQAYIVYQNQKVEVGRYGPGDIIGEVGLVSDDPAYMNYVPLVDTTVIKITRQDFSKQLKKADEVVKRVLERLIVKLNRIYKDKATESQDKAHIDHEAMQIVDHLTRKLDFKRKKDYEEVMLPHFNALVTAVRDVKQRHRLEDFQENGPPERKVPSEDDDENDEESAETATDSTEQDDSFSDSIA